LDENTTFVFSHKQEIRIEITKIQPYVGLVMKTEASSNNISCLIKRFDGHLSMCFNCDRDLLFTLNSLTSDIPTSLCPSLDVSLIGISSLQRAENK